jgi:hypothetical protein
MKSWGVDQDIGAFWHGNYLLVTLGVARSENRIFRTVFRYNGDWRIHSQSFVDHGHGVCERIKVLVRLSHHNGQYADRR